MKTKKTTRIFTETHEVLSVRRHAHAPSEVVVLCEECSSPVPLVSLEEALAVVGGTALAIYRLTEARLIHFRESPEGLVFVCLDSLIRFRASLE